MELSDSLTSQQDHNEEPQGFLTSSSLLRYPTLDITGDRVSSWLDNSSPAMSAPSEPHSDDDQCNLGNSAYEFIDTDTESRDGGTTGSVASTEYNGPDDDIASLADTEQSGDDSDLENSEVRDANDNHGIPSYHGLDGETQTPTIGQSVAGSQDDLDRPYTHSIEFEEPISIGAETISVKHTIKELDESTTMSASRRMGLYGTPTRLVATIRQTMTKQGLSTKEPLRILYIGSHSAKQDIIHKIASSVAASIENGRRSSSGGRSPQLFNVVPVTAFGSDKTPEVELMHSSGYQIKVEDCIGAINLKYEDEPEKPDVIKLSLDDNYSYHSVPDSGSFIVDPSWELPHVAIFYCAENDTIDARRTRTFARSFMNRHKIPSIVISHMQLFEKSSERMQMDHNAIHMCLESRDPEGRKNIIHERLPIDLASFMNIDARQMNRNLAYLTGLHEPSQSRQAISGNSSRVVQDVEKASGGLADSMNIVRTRIQAQWRTLLPFSLLVLGILASYLTANTKFIPLVEQIITSTHDSTQIPTSAITTSSVPFKSPKLDLITQSSLSTRTKTTTATETITVTQSKPSSPTKSLAIKPVMDIGSIAEKLFKSPETVTKQKTAKKYLKAAQKNGSQILITIDPSLKWDKAVISFQVFTSGYMGRRQIQPESANISKTAGHSEITMTLPWQYTCGVIVIKAWKEAGTKIEETMEVDFGSCTAQAMARAISELQTVFDGKIVRSPINNFWNYAQNTFNQTQVTQLRSQTLTYFQTAEHLAALGGAQLTSVAKNATLQLAKYSAILSKHIGIQADELRIKLSEEIAGWGVTEKVDTALMRARVQSKLAWLKIQGKMEEYAEYEMKAFAGMKKHVEEIRKHKSARREEKRKTRSDMKQTTNEKIARVKFCKACKKKGGNSMSCQRC